MEPRAAERGRRDLPAGRAVARILIADDARETRVLLRATLERHGGFEVVGEAADGASAIALTEVLRPDVLVLDLSMPGVDGFAVLSELRRNAPDVLVAVHSGLARDLTGLGPEDGVAAYLSKDLSPDELVAELRSLTDTPVAIPAPRSPAAPVTVDLLERLSKAMDAQRELLRPNPEGGHVLELLAERAAAMTDAAGAAVVFVENGAPVLRGGCGSLAHPAGQPDVAPALEAARAALETGEPALGHPAPRGGSGCREVALAVPLPTNEAGRAALVVVNPRRQGFAAHDRHLLGLLAPVAAARLDLEASNAAQRTAERLYAGLLHAEQRTFSEALQHSLLTEPPRTPGLEIAVRYQPATHDVQVGGDWYDALVGPSGETIVAIGDVVGHDTSATVMMGQLRGYLRAIAYTTGDGPAQLLRRLDAVMEGLELNTLATVLVARVEPGSDGTHPTGVGLRWSNAGHPPALLVHPDGGVQRLVADRTDCLLGVDADSPRGEHVTLLVPGDTLLLYTDGLVERADVDVDAGIDRLAAVLAVAGDRSVEALCDLVLSELAGTENPDDVAILAMRVAGG